MQWAKQKQQGFTIVELLIVVVVIAILAAITIVAYNGIQNRAKASSLQSELTNTSKALETKKLQNGTEQYPASLAAAGINLTDATYIYESSDNSFCLTKTNGTMSYYVSSFQKNPVEGTCGNDSLVGWWRFNGNATDSVGSNNGTIANATPSTGQNGQANGAYSFNGTNATINLGNSSVFNQRNISMSIWANPANTTSLLMLLGKEMQYKYRVTSGGAVGTLVGPQGSSWVAQPVSAGGVVTANAWNHIVLTIDSDKTTIKTYVNGNNVMTSTSTLTSPISAFNTNAMHVGSTNGAGEWFNGSLDDVRIYSRILGAAEIKGLFAAGAQ